MLTPCADQSASSGDTSAPTPPADATKHANLPSPPVGTPDGSEIIQQPFSFFALCHKILSSSAL